MFIKVGLSKICMSGKKAIYKKEGKTKRSGLVGRGNGSHNSTKKAAEVAEYSTAETNRLISRPFYLLKQE